MKAHLTMVVFRSRLVALVRDTALEAKALAASALDVVAAIRTLHHVFAAGALAPFVLVGQVEQGSVVLCALLRG